MHTTRKECDTKYGGGHPLFLFGEITETIPQTILNANNFLPIPNFCVFVCIMFELTETSLDYVKVVGNEGGACRDFLKKTERNK